MRLKADDALRDNDFYIVSGCGDDSAMMIAECYARGYEPKAVIFCDTGNEMPHTYKFAAFLSQWMMSNGWSKFVMIKKKNKAGDVINVYDENYKNGRMPPVLYGFKTCSERFKVELANRWIGLNEGLGKTTKKGIQVQWKNLNKKIIKAVGINADEQHRVDRWKDDDNFSQVFPLYDWDIGDKESASVVEEVGLYMPGKSSCFMCPNMTAEEIVYLHDNYPLMYYKALAMEANVIEQGNDFANVDRVFVVGNGIDEQIPKQMAKKTNKVVDLEKTEASMSKETKVKLGLLSNEQFDLFGVPKTKLVVRKVVEPTNFVGLARNKSWRDVVAYYQMTGQLDLTVGGEMCASGACGL